MQRLSLTLAVAVLAASVLLAQSGPADLTADELDFFRHTLLLVADPEARSGDLELREQAIVRHWHLNQAEAEFFRFIRQEFRGELLRLRSATLAIGSARAWKLTDAERAQMAALAVERDAHVMRLANRFLNGVRPPVAAWVRHLGARPR